MKKVKVSSLLLRCLGLVIVAIMMAIGALQHYGTVPGIKDAESKTQQLSEQISPDTTIIYTDATGKSISGYAGPVPVAVTIVDNRVVSVTPMDNAETPGFFRKVTESGLTHRWDGMDVNSARQLKVDGVSGATYSSRALIENVNLALDQYLNQQPVSQSKPLEIVWFAVLLVILSGALIPMWIHSRRYRLIQQLANVAVLGFWSGVFIDYTVVLGFISHPTISLATLSTIVLLIVAFLYPIVGYNGHYCAWICPFGSLQELSARLGKKHRIKLSPKTIKRLTTFRWVLWGVLMVMLWTGLFSQWIDYELFIAFSFKAAPIAITIIASALVVLSIFIPRAFCRFICPSGSLMHWNENI